MRGPTWPVIEREFRNRSDAAGWARLRGALSVGVPLNTAVITSRPPPISYIHEIHPRRHRGSLMGGFGHVLTGQEHVPPPNSKGHVTTLSCSHRFGGHRHLVDRIRRSVQDVDCDRRPVGSRLIPDRDPPCLGHRFGLGPLGLMACLASEFFVERRLCPHPFRALYEEEHRRNGGSQNRPDRCCNRPTVSHVVPRVRTHRSNVQEC